jgi:hypothetical protein
LATRRRRNLVILLTTPALGLILPFVAAFARSTAVALLLTVLAFSSWSVFTCYGYYKLGLRSYLAIIAGLAIAVLTTAFSFYLTIVALAFLDLSPRF